MKKQTNLIFVSILYISLISINCKAQDNHKIDSLKTLLSNARNDTSIMKLRIKIAGIYEKNLPDSAITWYNTVVDYLKNDIITEKNSGELYYTAFANLKLASVYNKKNNTQKTIEHYKTAINIFDETIEIKNNPYFSKSKNCKAICLNNLGAIFTNQDNFPIALDYFNQSLKIREELQDKNSVSVSLANLGGIYFNEGEYTIALEYYEKALKIAESAGDKKNISKYLDNVGNVYLNQGNYTLAYENYNKSLKIADELNDKSQVLNCFINIGNVYHYLNDNTKAIEYYEKSLLDCDKSKIPVILTYIGNTYGNDMNFTKDIEYQEKSLKAAEENGNKVYVVFNNNNLGFSYNRLGNYSKAKEYYEKALVIAENLNMVNDIIIELLAIGDVYMKQNQVLKAEQFFVRANKIIHSLLPDNFSISSEKEKRLYFDRLEDIVNSMNEFAMLTQYDSLISMCYNNELIKKGLLLQSTQRLINEVYSNNDTAMTNTFWYFKQLHNKLSNLSGITSNEKNYNSDSINNLANKEERKLLKLSKEFAYQQKQLSYKWEDVQHSLLESEAAIEFVKINCQLSMSQEKLKMGKDSFIYAALLIRPGYEYPKMIKMFAEKQLLDLMQKNVRNDKFYISDLYGKDKGQFLYKMIWENIENYLKDVKTVYLALTDILFQFSFAEIPTPDGKLLSDKYNINILSNTKDLIEKENMNTVNKNDRIVIYGGIKFSSDSTYINQLAMVHNYSAKMLVQQFRSADSTIKDKTTFQYLPGTLNEAEQIEKLFNKNNINASIISDIKATEESLKSLSGKQSPEIIHIATQGYTLPKPEIGEENKLFKYSFIQSQEPIYRTGLLFAGADRTWNGAKHIDGIDDGVLTAYELSNLDFKNTMLVVLSINETEINKVRSDDVIELISAFKMSGVKFLILNLWTVPDEQTSEFMNLFYSSLLNGKTVKEAYTSTITELKKKYSPYYWAGFILIK